MSKLKDRIYLVILFLAIISVFLIRFSYVSIGISVISLVLALVFSRKYLRILIVTVIICLSTISTDILIIYNNYNSTIIRRKTNRKIFEKTAFGATRTAQLKKLKIFWINF